MNPPENQSVGCGCSLMGAGAFAAFIGVANVYLASRDAGAFVADTRGFIAAGLGAFVLVTGVMTVARRMAASRKSL